MIGFLVASEGLTMSNHLAFLDVFEAYALVFLGVSLGLLGLRVEAGAC